MFPDLGCSSFGPATANITLDVAIHRSRRRLEMAGVLGSAGIVEVRRGERRFGTDRIQIVEE